MVGGVVVGVVVLVLVLVVLVLMVAKTITHHQHQQQHQEKDCQLHSLLSRGKKDIQSAKVEQLCENAAAMGIKLAGDSYISTNPYLLLQVGGGVGEWVGEWVSINCFVLVASTFNLETFSAILCR